MGKKTYHLNYYDENGRRRGKTFSAATLTEAKILSEEWEINHVNNRKKGMTVVDALEGYIKVKENVLSPSTIRSYKAYIKNHFETIGRKRLADLTKADVQKWVSDISDGLSPKSVKNCYALLSSALLMYNDRMNFKIQLPQAKPYTPYCPSDDDIQKLIEYAREQKDKSLLISICLAAFGPLRAGEICALQDSDVNGNFITVNKSMAYTENNEWVVKTPKTVGSNRTIEFHPFVINELAGIKGRLVPLTPVALYDRFRTALDKVGLPHFRFHDLRGYSISIQHAIGVADLYIMQRAGHSTDYTMKKHYRHIIDKEAERQNRKVVNYFQKFQ